MFFFLNTESFEQLEYIEGEHYYLLYLWISLIILDIECGADDDFLE